MRIGLLGLGTVGSAVARRLVTERAYLSEQAGADITLARVAVRDPGRTRDVDLGPASLTGDAAAVAGDQSIDIVVEVMGGMEPATTLIRDALTGGRGVVTANKAVIARHGPRLTALSLLKRRPLRFEAAVGGGVPVVSLLRESLLGDRLVRMEAVINGTCNFILDRMAAAGATFEEALSEAQEGGYAEADPAADIDGADSADKLSIMAWLGFSSHVAPGAIDTAGIRGLAVADIRHAQELGHTIRLIAGGERTPAGMSLWVRPTLVPAAHPLARVDGVGNGLVLHGDLAGRVVLTGVGAGADATASAVVADIVGIARMFGSGAVADPAPPERRLALLSAEEAETAAYLRVSVTGDPEAADTVALMLEDRGVRVDGLVEKRGRGAGELLLLTDPAPRAVLARALETLDTVPVVTRVAACLDRLVDGT